MIDSVGKRLKQLRIDKKLRQEQVAGLIGVNKKQVSAYENDTRQPSYDILVRLATLYRVSTDYILGCQINNSIDVSGLTPSDVALVSDLVNRLKSEYQQTDDEL